MKANIETQVQTTLVLNEEEARWLKGLVQNPLWVDHPDDENPTEKRIRESFWNALDGVEVF